MIGQLLTPRVRRGIQRSISNASNITPRPICGVRAYRDQLQHFQQQQQQQHNDKNHQRTKFVHRSYSNVSDVSKTHQR